MNNINQHNSNFNVQKLGSAYNVLYTEITGSTNEDATIAAKNGAQNLACFIADKQTSGKGRRGRVWQTFPYQSIACSLVVKTGGSEMLPLLVSLVLANSIFKATNIQTDIKWPNDILIKGKKVAGILVESFQHDNDNVYIVGIGLNINKVAKNELNLTTLEDESGKCWDREEILQDIIDELKHVLEVCSEKGWQAFKNDYEKKCITIGKSVIWNDGNNKISGIAKSIRNDGAIELHTEKETYFIRSGDIIEDEVLI